MSRSDDLEAIDVYIKSQPVRSSAAARIRDEWVMWYDDVSTLFGVSQEDYDHARNLRNDFNVANAANAAERAAAETTARTGMSNEELAGGTDRRLSSGRYDEPLLSANTRFLLATGIITLGVGFVVKKWLDFVKPF